MAYHVTNPATKLEDPMPTGPYQIPTMTSREVKRLLFIIWTLNCPFLAVWQIIHTLGSKWPSCNHSIVLLFLAAKLTFKDALYFVGVPHVNRSRQLTNVAQWQIRSTCRQHLFLNEQQNISFGPFYVSDKYKFVYCHTPKVACTSWRIAMARLYSRRASFDTFYNKIKQHASNFVKPGRYFQPHKIYQRLQTYYKFMFVREPLERLLSAYRMFFMSGNERLRGYKTTVRSRLRSNATGNFHHSLHGSTSCFIRNSAVAAIDGHNYVTLRHLSRVKQFRSCGFAQHKLGLFNNLNIASQH